MKTKMVGIVSREADAIKYCAEHPNTFYTQYERKDKSVYYVISERLPD